MRKLCVVFTLALLSSVQILGHVSAQTAAQAPSEQRKTSEPYTGDLSIFDSPGRDERLQINRVMDILGITAGKNVADIGAGSGWFTVRAAKRVGGAGVVYAVDINPEATRYIGERARKEKIDNVKTILSQADDPKLPCELGRLRPDAEDLPRNREAGDAAAEPADCASLRSQGWDHRPQWKWRGPWRGAQSGDS